jgi:hypothetical protein
MADFGTNKSMNVMIKIGAWLVLRLATGKMELKPKVLDLLQLSAD